MQKVIQSTPPLVSVIIPIYNVEKYLVRCLNSVVNQTLKDIEIICVDDGSPDRSGEIADEYAKKYDNICVIHQKNCGVSVARNTGLDAAKAKYVYFLDPDDWIEPNAMEELYSKAEELKIEILSFNTQVRFESEEVQKAKAKGYENAYIRSQKYGGKVYTGPELAAIMRPNGDWHNAVWLAFIRRDFLQDNCLRFFPIPVNEDVLFAFQCVLKSKRVSFVDKIYHNYFVRGSSLTTTKGSGIKQTYIYARLVVCLEMMKFIRDTPPHSDTEIVFYRWIYLILLKAINEFKTMRPEAPKSIDCDRQDVKAMFHIMKKIVDRDKKITKLSKENEGYLSGSRCVSQLQADLDKKTKELEKAKKELTKIKNSNSYKIGRAITYLPRKIWDF